MKDKYKPGPGWKCLKVPVWERSTGTKVHMWGYCLVNGQGISTQGAEYLEAAKMIRINGGNRRRGLMAWARRHEGGEG